MLLSLGGDVGKRVKGAAQDSFHVLRARYCPPSIQYAHPPKVSAGRGRRPFALAPSSLEERVKVRPLYLALLRREKPSVEGM